MFDEAGTLAFVAEGTLEVPERVLTDPAPVCSKETLAYSANLPKIKRLNLSILSRSLARSLAGPLSCSRACPV